MRRLPCAHVFHSYCIAKWFHLKLTCPLDNLPVDDSLEMLAAAATGSDAAVQDRPQPNALGCQSSSRASMQSRGHSPAPLPPSDADMEFACMPPLGLAQLQAAAEGAGMSPGHLADSLARLRTAQLQAQQPCSRLIEPLLLAE